MSPLIPFALGTVFGFCLAGVLLVVTTFVRGVMQGWREERQRQQVNRDLASFVRRLGAANQEFEQSVERFAADYKQRMH